MEARLLACQNRGLVNDVRTSEMEGAGLGVLDDLAPDLVLFLFAAECDVGVPIEVGAVLGCSDGSKQSNNAKLEHTCL